MEKKTITRLIKMNIREPKKNSWQPLLLRDKIGEKRGLFKKSAVTRNWDKAKAREMVSSGPVVIESIVSDRVIIRKQRNL
jgi:hypothetical protein